MPNRFCYKCGGEEWKDGLCKEHFLDGKVLLDLPKRIDIEKCSKGGLVRLKNKQHEWQPEEFFTRLAGRPIEIEGKKKLKDMIYTISVTDTLDGAEKTETCEVRVHFDVKICGVCGRVLSNYYEGILQLRGNFPDNIMKFIDNHVNKSTDRMVFYRLEQLKEGINLYFGSQRFLKKLSGQISKKFGVRIKETFKQVTQREGKEIRRRIAVARFD